MILQCYDISALVMCAVLLVNVNGELCPKQCDCSRHHKLNMATCVDQNIISIEVGVPSAVQIYNLRHNLISELNNFCFKEAGYLSLQVLNLSYNKISWIGLNAFAGLDQLIHLDISNNILRYIHSDLLSHTPKLVSIDLSSNIFESLKNEPFLIHEELQILNLNNCRIKELPGRLFSRLPNLKKIDISENYMITLDINVLVPLRRLERIELKNRYWVCNDAFKNLESWIVSKRIAYYKQCPKNSLKMSEKMISMVSVEGKDDVDVKQVWSITMATDDVPATTESPPTSFQKFDQEFSAVQAFIMGAELGLAIGMIGTYIWLRKLFYCGRSDCTLPQTRRQRRRAQRVADADMRTNLIFSNATSPDMETPPSFRRQAPLNDSYLQVPSYGIPVTRESGLQADAIRVPRRPETPPPPYDECRLNI